VKLAIDCREFHEGRITGIGRYLGDFISFASRERRGWEFVLFGSQHTRVPFRFGENVKIENIHEVNTQIWDQVLLPAALKRLKCDIYFSPYNKTCLFSSVPSVIAIHDLTGLIYPGYGRGAFLERQLARLYAAKAAAVLTLSGNSKNDIVRLLGVAPEKISVSGAGVDGKRFYRRDDCAFVTRKYGIGKPYVLYVGNSRPHKNLAGLLGAWSLLDGELRDRYSLVLAGVGDYRSPRPGTGVAIGSVPDADLPFLYSGAELLVSPSFYEGFGLPALEAMACGTPVVSSNTSCLPEVLGDACAYFDPRKPREIAAAVAAVLRDPPLRLELRKKGLARAALYSPEKSAAAIIGVLESVINSSGGAL